MLVCFRNLCDCERPQQNAAADVDVIQLVSACCERFVQLDRDTGAPAKIQPVAAFYNLDRFFCGSQFALIERLIIHT